MTEKEKKAINNFKEIIENLDEDEQIEYEEEIQDYKTLLNLIEKQLGKIEELKKHKEHEQEYLDGKYFSAKQMHYIEDNYIFKDKIREKIKIIESYAYVSASKARMRDYACDKLKELLEE